MAATMTVRVIYGGRECDLHCGDGSHVILEDTETRTICEQFPVIYAVNVSLDGDRLSITWARPISWWKSTFLRLPEIECKHLLLVVPKASRPLVPSWIVSLKTYAQLPDVLRQWVAIINPIAGSGKAAHVFQQTAVLTAAGISVTIRHTLRPGHAVELGKLQQPGDDCFHGIICCGGDGHIAQVQQSNLRFRKVPIAIVPAGTDNALAATLCIRSWFHAVLTIIKGHIEPIDTVSVHEVDLVTRHGASPSENYLRVGKCLTYAHSCVGWAFVGDVLEDIEKHRWMGKSKTVFCGGKRMLSSVGTHSANCFINVTDGGPNAPCFVTERATECAACQQSRLNSKTTMLSQGEALTTAGWQHLAIEKFSSLTIGPNKAKNMSVPSEGAMFPHGHVNDGHMEVLAAGKLPWIRFLGLVLRISADGHTHIQQQDVHYCKASQVLIVRSDDSSNTAFGIDGEVIYPTTPRILLQVRPNLAHVFVPPPDLVELLHKDTCGMVRRACSNSVIGCCGCLDFVTSSPPNSKETVSDDV